MIYKWGRDSCRYPSPITGRDNHVRSWYSEPVNLHPFSLPPGDAFGMSQNVQRVRGECEDGKWSWFYTEPMYDQVPPPLWVPRSYLGFGSNLSLGRPGEVLVGLCRCDVYTLTLYFRMTPVDSKPHNMCENILIDWLYLWRFQDYRLEGKKESSSRGWVINRRRSVNRLSNIQRLRTSNHSGTLIKVPYCSFIFTRIYLCHM